MECFPLKTDKFFSKFVELKIDCGNPRTNTQEANNNLAKSLKNMLPLIGLLLVLQMKICGILLLRKKFQINSIFL